MKSRNFLLPFILMNDAVGTSSLLAFACSFSMASLFFPNDKPHDIAFQWHWRLVLAWLVSLKNQHKNLFKPSKSLFTMNTEKKWLAFVERNRGFFEKMAKHLDEYEKRRKNQEN